MCKFRHVAFIRICNCYICVQLYAYVTYLLRIRLCDIFALTEVRNLTLPDQNGKVQCVVFHKPSLTLLLLNSTCPVLGNRVDQDQLASVEAY